MAANQSTFRFADFVGTALENPCNDGWRDQISRDPKQIQCGQRTPAHGIDVRKRVGSRDLAVHNRIVNNRREEIDRLNQSAFAVQAVNSRIIGCVGADKEIWIVLCR